MKKISLALLMAASVAAPAMAGSEQTFDTGREAYPTPAVQGVVSVSKPDFVDDTGREAYPRPLIQGQLGAHVTAFAR